MENITYDKPFKTYEELIEIMKSRHIIIDDLDFAQMTLSNLSYYSIINGYKNTFLQLPNSDNFIEGTRFEELYTLHIIDVSLNNILFKYILYVEKSLKSKLSYLISEQFGVFTDGADLSNNNPNDYLFNRNYSNSNKRRDSVLRLIKKCVTTPKNNTSLTHYINNKNHIPAWILMGNIPFGLAIEWYNILAGISKSNICNQFIHTDALTDEEQKAFFRKSLDLLKEYRNKIAHGNRTFSMMQLSGLPKKQLLLLSLGALTGTEYDNGRGRNDVLAVFFVILILLNDQFLLSNFYHDCKVIFQPYEKTKFNNKSVFEIFSLPEDIWERIEKILKARFT